jgi:hypothetical protein
VGLGRLLFDYEQQLRAIDRLSGENVIGNSDADLDRELEEFIYDKG